MLGLLRFLCCRSRSRYFRQTLLRSYTWECRAALMEASRLRVLPAYPATRFGSASLAAADAGYRFPNNFGVGMRVEQTRLTLTESANELGRLRAQFYLAEVTWHSSPQSGSGVGGHFHAGTGLALSVFKKGRRLSSPCLLRRDREAGFRRWCRPECAPSPSR